MFNIEQPFLWAFFAVLFPFVGALICLVFVEKPRGPSEGLAGLPHNNPSHAQWAAPVALLFSTLSFAFLCLAGLGASELGATGLGATGLGATGLGATGLNATGAGLAKSYEWIPSLGLSFGILLDKLSLFFALVVTGVGALICLYAQNYLHDSPRLFPRFYSSLLFFMGAMLGVVLSSNLLSLFLFWELTGVASFLLIGFDFESEEGKRGARMALLTTAATGLALMLGVVLVGEAFGSFSMDVILNSSPKDPTKLAWAVPFLLAGAFGKSAQFPLQYWLPNAMAAPTPVSAYLHSATMVKLGVFLVARLNPVFEGVPAWSNTLLMICFVTAALGAFLSFLSHDLKAILAYSTVSQLGVLMGLCALGRGASTDIPHVLAHVLYKGGLFMLAGIVDHAAGSRDLRKLGGLGKRSPTLAILGLLLCLSMASFPGTLAFVSKELLIEDFLANLDPLRSFAFGLFLFAAVLKVAIAGRIFTHLFVRKAPHKGADLSNFHAPGVLLMASPFLLAVLSVFFGAYPQALEGFQRMPSLSPAAALDFAGFHGFNVPFAISMGATLAGAGVYFVAQTVGWNRLSVPKVLQFDLGFDALHKGIMSFGESSVRAVRGDTPREFVPITLAMVSATALAFLWSGGLLQGMDWNALLQQSVEHSWSPAHVARIVSCISMIFAGCMVLIARKVLTRLVATSLIGLLITVLYVLFRAPDLALTQILVETLVLIATVVLLVRIKAVNFAQAEVTTGVRKGLHALIAGSVGLLMTALILLTQTSDRSQFIGPDFLKKTLPEAAGANAVNTVIVDFRGTDTLFEITVLIIALLGCIGLVKTVSSRASQSKGEPKNV